MRHLPVDERGYPVPWFVAFIDGKPDFRVVRPNGVAEAWNKQICWLCGHPLGAFKVNVVGPMCGINRVTSEPPQHLECAEFAVKACPFMTRPMAVRRERGLDEACPGKFVSGIGIKRNPGVALIWSTRHVKPFKAHNNGGWLFKLGEPVSWSWWREGRRATRAEVDEAVRTGLLILEEAARKDGPRGLALIQAAVARFSAFLPPHPKGDDNGSGASSG